MNGYDPMNPEQYEKDSTFRLKAMWVIIILLLASFFAKLPWLTILLAGINVGISLKSLVRSRQWNRKWRTDA